MIARTCTRSEEDAVDEILFLSRPQDVGDAVAADSLDDRLKADARAADRITILSAYHRPDYVRELLACVKRPNRGGCEVTLVFGLEQERSLGEAVRGLRTLKADLVKLGFKQPVLKLYRPGVPFHTKLYHFKRRTHPVWYIGSANASRAVQGERHEMMMRLRGRHEELSAYVTFLAEHARAIDDTGLKQDAAYDLQSFFLSGSLCFAPVSSRRFTFEAFALTATQRRKLNQELKRGSKVPHADPQTKGFGFSLTSAVQALRGITIPEPELDDEAEAESELTRLRFRHMSVETVYGYWLPAPYGAQLKARAQNAQMKRFQVLRSFAADLSRSEDSSLERELTSYVAELERFFQDAGAPLKAEVDYKKRFSKFLEGRREWMDDEDRLERMARRVHVEPMPPIWSDDVAGQEFENWFFDEVADRLSTRRKSQIVEVLQRELHLETGATSLDVRKKLERRLKQGWSDSVWTD